MSMDSNDAHRAGWTPSDEDFEDLEPEPGTEPALQPLPTVALAVERFLARQGGKPPVLFPWPGGREEMPPEDERLPAGAVLPPEDGCKGVPWERFWRKVRPLWPDRLAVLVGMTGRGKSGFALQTAEAVARAGHPVLYVSAEMGTDELVARLLALRAREGENYHEGPAWRSIMMGAAPIEDLKSACAALVQDCPRLFLWAPAAADRTPAFLEGWTRAVVDACDGAPPLVVIDYLQRMAEGEDLRGATRAVSGMLRDLSRPGGLGKDWPGAAVFALSSTARSNYGHMTTVDALNHAYCGFTHKWTDREGKEHKTYHPPEELVGMGKESGELETDASLLLVMTTDRAKKDGPESAPRIGLVVVPKNRAGGEGEVDFDFYPATGRFVERKPQKAAIQPRPTRRERTDHGAEVAEQLLDNQRTVTF